MYKYLNPGHTFLCREYRTHGVWVSVCVCARARACVMSVFYRLCHYYMGVFFITGSDSNV